MRERSSHEPQPSTLIRNCTACISVKWCVRHLKLGSNTSGAASGPSLHPDGGTLTVRPWTTAVGDTILPNPSAMSQFESPREAQGKDEGLLEGPIEDTYQPPPARLGARSSVRQSIRKRLSTLVLGRDSSLFAEVRQAAASRHWATLTVLRVLDSLPFQIYSLSLVIFTLFAVDVATLLSAPDSADHIINAFLLASMASFSLEIGLSVACRPKLRWFPVALDIIATLSILVDVTWVAEAVGISSSGSAAIVRAGRIFRLVRVVRILRLLSVLTTIVNDVMVRWTGKAEDMHAPSNIGFKLTDATTMQVALVVICTVIGAALLLGLGDTSTAPLEAFVAIFGSADSAALPVLVDEMLLFSAQHIPDMVPLALTVGSLHWDWTQQHGGYPARRPDTVKLASEDGGVELWVDISRVNHHAALMDIALIVFIVGLLVLFVATLNLTAYRLLVRPLERIFHIIRRNAAQIVSALEPAEGGPNGPGHDGRGGSEDDDGDVGTIAAAVEKMSRIVAHFTSGGGQGAQLMKNVAQHADHATQEWLSQFVGGAGGPDNSKDARRDTSEPGLEGSSHGGGGGGGGGGDFRISSSPGGPYAGPRAARNSSVGPSPLGRGSGGSTKLDRRSSLQVFQTSSPKPSVAAAHAGTLPPTTLGNAAAAAAASTIPVDTPRGLTRTFLEASGLSAAQHAALLAMDSARLHSLAYDVTELEEASLVPFVVSMFMDLNLAYCRGVAAEEGAWGGGGDQRGCAGGLMDVVVLWRFVEQVASRYQRVPYHNFFHAVDVLHTVFNFIRRVGSKVGLTALERLALMVAALCHDMEHPGVNNAFLVSTKAGLATTYNDTSVLENRHVAALYDMLAAHPDVDIFRNLDPGQWREVRRCLIAAVLHTDMVHHFPMVSKVEVFYELHSAEVVSTNKAARRGLLMEEAVRVFTSTEDRQLMLCLLLHCADIGNPLRPAHIARKWAQRVMEEFFRQGDMERAAGLPVSPMCDRTKATMPQSQLNFIEFVVAPLYVQVAQVFPELGDLINNMEANMRMWSAQLLIELEADPAKSLAGKAAEQAKLEARLAAFLDKHRELFARCSRRAAAASRYPGGDLAVPPPRYASSIASTAGLGALHAVPAALLTARIATSAASITVDEDGAAAGWDGTPGRDAGDEAATAALPGPAAAAAPAAGGVGRGEERLAAQQQQQLRQLAAQQPQQQQQQHLPQQPQAGRAEPTQQSSGASALTALQPGAAAGGAMPLSQSGVGPGDAVVTIRRTISGSKAGLGPSAGVFELHAVAAGTRSPPGASLAVEVVPLLRASSPAARAGTSRAGSRSASRDSRHGSAASRGSFLESAAAVTEALLGTVSGAGSQADGGSSSSGSGSSGAGLLRRGASRSLSGVNRVLPQDS